MSTVLKELSRLREKLETFELVNDKGKDIGESFEEILDYSKRFEVDMSTMINFFLYLEMKKKNDMHLLELSSPWVYRPTS